MPGTERRRAAMKSAKAAGCDGLLVTHGPDVRWLTGFTGSNGAVALAGGRAALFTDGRYTAQAQAEAPGLRVVIAKKAVAAAAVEWMAARGVTRCALDARQTTLAALDAMRKALPKDLGTARRSFFVAGEPLVADLRQIKDEDEIRRMRRAAKLGCDLFETVRTHLVPGTTEAEVALALEFEARSAGAEAMSFETIVASGKRSALPHGRASLTRLPRRGFVTLDFGVVLGGYCSDMTRTVFLGKARQQERDVYDAVLEAQEAALEASVAGAMASEVDEAARSVLGKAGLGKWFTHSTGHGVGLEIHEEPRVAATSTAVLQAGMVITVEPGVYLENAWGIRIEDMVLLTESGQEVLTAQSPKHLMEL